MIPIVIPSHLRHDKVTTTSFIENPILVIPKGQKDAYKSFNDVEIVTHPDNVIGLSAKLQWMLEKFGKYFSVDDDVVGVQRLYLPSDHKKPPLKKKEITGWINDLCNYCEESKIHLFGFNVNPHPLRFRPQKPIALNQFVRGGSFGIIGDKNLYFPDENIDFTDYWITCLNAHYNKVNLVDNRIAFVFKDTNHNTGGCADYRTESVKKKSFLYLRQAFGSSIYIDDKKKRLSEFEPNIKIPF